ncbi:MAG: hypothetical protein M3N95_08430 [Actinomycetota bacterium]|nr:hypothetical protein [Actinomycetota bacterium]
MTDQPTARDDARPPVAGRDLAGGLAASAALMLGAASLGWAGIPILFAFMALGAMLLVRWSRGTQP